MRSLLIATLAGALSILVGADTFAAGRNVVMIVADDLGLQLGCYGDDVAHTPHLDRLAAEGTRFTRAYCNTSSCSPSRAEILTGLYAHSIVSYGDAEDWNNCTTYDNVLSLPARLNAAGYRTCSIGKHTLRPERLYHFTHYGNDGGSVEGRARDGAQIEAASRAFLEAEPDKPFFLYVSTSDPHRAGGSVDGSGFALSVTFDGYVPRRYEPGEMVVPAWLPDTPEVRDELAAFYESIARFDQCVGRVMKVIDETGHRDDTLVIVLSDNGPPFPGAKTTQYEPGIHLPLIVRHPNQQKRGLATDAGVSWVDLTPTVIDFCGLPPAEPPKKRPTNRYAAEHGELHGRSFLPVLEREHPEGWERVFCGFTAHDVTVYYPVRTLFDGRMKYLFNVAHQLPYPFASDLYGSRTWQGVMERGDTQFGSRTVEAYIHRPRHELYDLAADPNESHNLADDPAYADTLARMQKLLQEEQRRTKDPWIKKWSYE